MVTCFVGCYPADSFTPPPPPQHIWPSLVAEPILVEQAGTALILVSANAVPANVRGQFGGLFAVAGSLGRALGPAVLSSLLAWSLHSPSSSSANGLGGPFVDYHLVFVLEAILMLVVTLLGMKVFTLEALTIPVEDRPRLYEALEVEQRDDCSDVDNGVLLVEVHIENGACRRRDPSTPS